MCIGNGTGWQGAMDAIRAKKGGGAVLSSGGYSGGAVPMTTKDVLRRRRKQGIVPEVPVLAQSGEQVPSNTI